MKAKLLAVLSEFDASYEQVSEEYQNLDLDSFVARTKIIAPHVFLESPYDEEIENEIQSESDNYILTYEDGCGECVRIYQKL